MAPTLSSKEPKKFSDNLVKATTKSAPAGSSTPKPLKRKKDMFLEDDGKPSSALEKTEKASKKAKKSDEGSVKPSKPTKASKNSRVEDAVSREVEPPVKTVKSNLETKKTKAAPLAAVIPEPTSEKRKNTNTKPSSKLVGDVTLAPLSISGDKSTKRPAASKSKKPASKEDMPTSISRPRKGESTASKSKSKKSKGPTPEPEPAADEDEDEEMGDEDEAEGEVRSDSDASVHLHGFSTDEEDSSDDDAMDDEPTDFDMGKLPTIAKDDETVKRKLEKAKRQPTEDRGVLYLGRLPHGFYEDQLKGYFSQFGTVTRVRVSRNKKTGASKHYAFLEFDSLPVARIVAETMDNYLLTGHILRCKVIPKEDVHPELWVGANRKWRVVPRERVAKAEHNKLRTDDEQNRAAKRLLKRQQQRKLKLAEAGIKYDFDAAAYKKPKPVVA